MSVISSDNKIKQEDNRINSTYFNLKYMEMILDNQNEIKID